jgi:hypothetical protein
MEEFQSHATRIKLETEAKKKNLEMRTVLRKQSCTTQKSKL